MSPRGPGLGFPLGCGSSLGLGWVMGQSGVNIVHMYGLSQGVRVTFGGRGHPTHSVLETLRLRSGRTEFPAPWGWIPARWGMRLQEGWVPASAGMTDGGGGGILGMRRICCSGPPPARPFDGAQGERPRLRGWVHASAHATGASSRGGRSAYRIYDRVSGPSPGMNACQRRTCSRLGGGMTGVGGCDKIRGLFI